MYVICKQWEFYFFVYNLDFFSFSALFVMAGTSRSVLNNSGESGHPCLVPNLRRNAFIFFTIENKVCWGFVLYGFYYVEVCFFCADFLERFFFVYMYCKWVLNFVESFLYKCWMIIRILPFDLLIWCISLIDLLI